MKEVPEEEGSPYCRKREVGMREVGILCWDEIGKRKDGIGERDMSEKDNP